MNEISFRTGSWDEVAASAFASGADPTSVDDLVLLAEFQGQIVGYLVGSSDRFGGLVVSEHVVDQAFRDRGVGRRLLLEAARRSPPKSQITIDPTGEFAIAPVAAYYAGLGFPDVPDDEFKVSSSAHAVVDAIGERLEEHTTLGAILRRKPTGAITVKPHMKIVDALALLDDMSIGCVVVSSDESSIDGLLSERDIVVGLRRDGAVMLNREVSTYMSAEVVRADVSEVIADAMEIMTARRLRHLPVTDNDVLVGMVSVGDLLVFRMREHDMRREGLPHRVS